MRVEDCYLLGNIVKPHGLDGEVQVFLDVDEPDSYDNLESVFVFLNQKLVPFFIETIAVYPNKCLLKFEDVDSRESAEDIAGKELYLPLNTLPELSDDQYYFHEIIGFDIIENDKILGKVENVFEFSSQNLLSTTIENKEVLIPIKDDIIVKVDKQAGSLIVNLPDGLIDVYLNEGNRED